MNEDDVIVTVCLVDGEVVFDMVQLEPDRPAPCPWAWEHGPSMWHGRDDDAEDSERTA